MVWILIISTTWGRPSCTLFTDLTSIPDWFNTAAVPSVADGLRLAAGIATLLIAVGWGRRFHDLGPFRALRLKAWVGRLPADPAFGWNVEMNVRALEAGLEVREVPLPASIRPHGRNRISGTLRGIAGAGYGMLRRLYLLRENGIEPIPGRAVTR